MANFGFMSQAWKNKTQDEQDAWTRLWVAELAPYADDVVERAAHKLIQESPKDKVPTVGEILFWCRTVIGPPAHQPYQPERPQRLPDSTERSLARQATIRAFNKRLNPLVQYAIDYDGPFPFRSVADAIDLPRTTELERSRRLVRGSKGFPGMVRAWDTLFRLFDELWAEGPEVWALQREAEGL